MDSDEVLQPSLPKSRPPVEPAQTAVLPSPSRNNDSTCGSSSSSSTSSSSSSSSSQTSSNTCEPNEISETLTVSPSLSSNKDGTLNSNIDNICGSPRSSNSSSSNTSTIASITASSSENKVSRKRLEVLMALRSTWIVTMLRALPEGKTRLNLAARFITRYIRKRAAENRVRQKRIKEELYGPKRSSGSHKTTRKQKRQATIMTMVDAITGDKQSEDILGHFEVATKVLNGCFLYGPEVEIVPGHYQWSGIKFNGKSLLAGQDLSVAQSKVPKKQVISISPEYIQLCCMLCVQVVSYIGQKTVQVNTGTGVSNCVDQIYVR